jgi:hypothetical protein
MTRRLAFAALLCSIITVPPAAQETPHAAADRARVKIDSIIAIGEEQHRRAAPARTALTEVEINAYLQVHGPGVLPKGIAEPEVRFGDDSRIRARAIVDLDEVCKSRPHAWRDPLAYVIGSVEVVASGRIVADEGIGRAQFESATVGGVSVPKSVVQELLRFYTVAPERPEGFDLDEPFELPANIRRVLVRRGGATFVQ